MRKIKLETVIEFGSRADFAIWDVTEDSHKKRGTITIDYAPSDVQQLIDQGLTLESALEYYQNRIYGLVKHYISGDWQDAGGCHQAMEIIKKHIGPHF